MYLGTQASEQNVVTKKIKELTSNRSSDEEHRADALALGADEGRDKLR